MERKILLLTFLGLTLAGCRTPVSSSVGTFNYPNDGNHRVYGPDGNLLQTTKWRKGYLVSAWQWEQPFSINPSELRQKEWTKVVIKGTGAIFNYDTNGRETGFERFHKGVFIGGAH